MKIYTSFYKKMLGRHKKEFDCYIKVSRSLYYPFKNVDGIYMKDLIDYDCGKPLGNYGSLNGYLLNLYPEDVEEFAEILKRAEKEEADGDVFILCFENLDECYTKADEKRMNGLVRAGQKKECHRTLLANFLNSKYNLNITEYKGE